MELLANSWLELNRGHTPHYWACLQQFLNSPLCLLCPAHFFHAPYPPGHGVGIWVSFPGLFANHKRGSIFDGYTNNTQKLAGRITSLTGSFSLERFITYTDCRSLEQVGDAATKPVYVYGMGRRVYFFFFLRLRMGFSKDFL